MLFLLCTDVQSGKFADLSQEAWKYGAKMGWECIQQKITDRLTDWLLISDKDKDKHRHKHKKHWERFRDFVTI